MYKSHQKDGIYITNKNTMTHNVQGTSKRRQLHNHYEYYDK